MARSSEKRKVSTTRLTRAQELRLAGICAVLIATVLGTAAAALASSSATTPTAAPSSTVRAVDIVPPTPVALTFAAPRHAAVAAPARRPAPLAAPVTLRRTAVAAQSDCGDAVTRGQAALDGLLHPVAAGITYTFTAGRGALKGMTYYDTHHVDVYVQSCARESDALLRHVVAHETGHAWDSLHMTDALRAEYLAARGIPAGTPWFGCDRCQDFATPAGDFAETYAQWQRGASDSRSTIAPPATAAQLADLGARFFS